jgi:hypothetical protein
MVVDGGELEGGEKREDENLEVSFPFTGCDWLGWFWEKQRCSVALA